MTVLEELRQIAIDSDSPYERKLAAAAADEIDRLTRRWKFDASLLRDYRVHCVKKAVEHEEHIAKLEAEIERLKQQSVDLLGEQLEAK